MTLPPRLQSRPTGRSSRRAPALTTSNYDFALARYNSDGSLDTSFGGTGKVTTDFTASYDFADSIAIEADGKIVAAGYTVTRPKVTSRLPATTATAHLTRALEAPARSPPIFSGQTTKPAPSPSRLTARSSRPATAVTRRIMISPLSATARPAAAQRRPRHQLRR